MAAIWSCCGCAQAPRGGGDAEISGAEGAESWLPQEPAGTGPVEGPPEGVHRSSGRREESGQREGARQEEGSGQKEDGKQRDADLSAAPAEVDEPLDSLAVAAEEIATALLELRADLAWARFKGLRATFGAEGLAARLERLAEPTGVPIRWMEAWGPVFEELWETLTVGAIPPPDTPRAGETSNCPGWTVFPLNPEEDAGIEGAIYARYLPSMHAVEIRSELIIPGTFKDHFVGLAEVDLSATLATSVFAEGEGWRGTIPGNVLYWLVAKPPMFSSKVFWRDIVMHRQLVRHGKGVAAVEYSPTAFRRASLNPASPAKDRAQCYIRGGGWKDGLPGVGIPKCKVSGRDSAIGGSYITPIEHADGSQFVCFRNCQIAEVHFPQWFPMPQKWYGIAAGLIQRSCMREFTLATTRSDSIARQEYEKRAALRPSWYRQEWLSQIP